MLEKKWTVHSGLDEPREAKPFQDARKREKGSRKKKSMPVQQCPVKIEYEEFNVHSMNGYSEISKIRVKPLADPIPQTSRKQAQKDPKNSKVPDGEEFLFRKVRSISGHE